MSLSNSEKLLNSLFYEADVFNIGAKSKNNAGRASEQQPILGILSTDKGNNYPRFIKLRRINDYTGLSLKKNIEQCCILTHAALLNTDGEKGFNTLNEEIQVKNEKISYEEKNHRLLWLNIIIGNIKNNITGICHGVTKRDLPLFLNEQEWRFNHRYTGKNFMNKIQKYVLKSHPCPKKAIITVLNLSKPYYAHVSDG